MCAFIGNLRKGRLPLLACSWYSLNISLATVLCLVLPEIKWIFPLCAPGELKSSIQGNRVTGCWGG